MGDWNWIRGTDQGRNDTFSTGIDLVRNVLGHVLDNCESYGDELQKKEMDVKVNFLKSCERWTHYVPLHFEGMTHRERALSVLRMRRVVTQTHLH